MPALPIGFASALTAFSIIRPMLASSNAARRGWIPMSILAGFAGTDVPGISAALNGPELLIVLCAGAAAWMLIQGRQTATERKLPEELDQTPLYAERCGAPGRGRTAFQRLALSRKALPARHSRRAPTTL